MKTKLEKREMITFMTEQMRDYDRRGDVVLRDQMKRHILEARATVKTR